MEVSTHQLSDADAAFVHLTTPKEANEKAVVTVYVTTAREADGAPLGSMIYALPSNGGVVSTRVYQVERSIDSTERLAKVLCSRFKRPIIAAVDCDLATTSIGEIIRIVQEKLN